jgi:chemotaxis protein methyltransferase CheR
MLSSVDFDFIRRIVREGSAIALDESKNYLARARLDTLARQEGMASPAEIIARLRCETAPTLRRKVIEAMTTNETSFFRDIHPFEALRTDLLPELLRRRAREQRLCIWSAACSSGQEPYSLAILIREHFPSLLSWNLTLTATDLSGEMLDRARSGRYSQMEVNRGVPAAMLVRYFQRDGLDWFLRDEVRKMVDFRPINLAAEWPGIPTPDLVLLRNVLIYFESETKRQILARLARTMAPDGYLILGGAENVLDSGEWFERAGPPRSGAYRPRVTA